MPLNIENLHIGMKVNHPRYGVGVVKALTQHTADISFDDAPCTLDRASADLASAEPTATLRELQIPLANLIRDTAEAVVESLGLEKKTLLLKVWRIVGKREASSCNRPTRRFSRKKYRSKPSFTRS